VIERAKAQPPDQTTLNRIKSKLRADLIRGLASNTGLAVQLCSYHVNYGDWRRLFTELEDYGKVTAEDVVRVAKKYLVPEKRTVGFTYIPNQKASAQ
jgi:predicted Zn-dependent peptidase